MRSAIRAIISVRTSRFRFFRLAVEDLGDDRVRVSGAIGRPRPETLKVSATYRDGFRAAGTLTIIGRDANDQRHGVAANLFWSGFGKRDSTLRDSVIECSARTMAVRERSVRLRMNKMD